MATTLDLSPAEKLRTTAAAVRIHFNWFGVRRAVEDSSKDTMAESVSADKALVSASKKILNNKSPAWRKLSGVRQTIRSYWRGMTLPYTEPGVRLLRQDWVEPFTVRMTELQGQLEAAVSELEAAYASLKTEAQARLGKLFNGGDYPLTMSGLFSVVYDFPSLEPPDYLMKLNPALYEQERQRISAQFQQAVKLGEQAFAAELADMVKRMAEALQPGEDGKAKKFHSSTVSKFGDFFARFKDLSVGGNADLEKVVADAHKLMSGLDADTLKGDGVLQKQVKDGLAEIGEALAKAVVVAPRRKMVFDDDKNGEKE